MAREHVPAHVRRQVLIEAGHRCAIPTCRATTIDVAHIVPWAKSQDHSPENLIALCPNCHRRFDRGEIDQTAMRAYKRNLVIVGQRYTELERRILEEVARTGKRFYIVGPGGDMLCASAVRDGLLDYKPDVKGVEIDVKMDGRPYRTFPTVFAYWVTPKGIELATKYAAGETL